MNGRVFRPDFRKDLWNQSGPYERVPLYKGACSSYRTRGYMTKVLLIQRGTDFKRVIDNKWNSAVED